MQYRDIDESWDHDAWQLQHGSGHTRQLAEARTWAAEIVPREGFAWWANDPHGRLPVPKVPPRQWLPHEGPSSDPNTVAQALVVSIPLAFDILARALSRFDFLPWGVQWPLASADCAFI